MNFIKLKNLEKGQRLEEAEQKAQKVKE